MILFEVLRKRNKFGPILEKTWQHVSADLPYPQSAEEDPGQKLVYFGIVVYATVFESALAAGMSTSAAHYLARMQIGKYQLDQSIIRTVEEIFSGHETEEARVYAEFFLSRLAKIITMVMAGEEDIAPVMLELSQGF